MDQVKLSEFDRYGTFFLNRTQIAGVEHLVQELEDDRFLSRNSFYYPKYGAHRLRLHFRDVCAEYAHLNALLPRDGKAAFVICEKMHELAICTVNAIQQTYQRHLFQDGVHFDTVAQKCAQECADNLVRLIHGQTATKTPTDLRDETGLALESIFQADPIEADDKKQLFMCANALPEDAEHLLTPGRGSSKLGTLVQAVRKHKGLKPLGFTQIYYSRYVNEQAKVPTNTLKHLPEKLLVMDDFIYCGHTLMTIKEQLSKRGHQVTTGALTTAFYTGGDGVKTVFRKKRWAKHIDIIPNQFAAPIEQLNFAEALYLFALDRETGLDEIDYLLDTPRNGAWVNTPDYYAMRQAEKRAHALGADLYQVSAKISPAAVAYNQKIRTQVVQSNAEFQKSFEV